MNMAYALNPLPAINALKRVGPRSSYQGYDQMTEGDPNYPPWSAQRPAPTGVGSTVPTTITQGPTINTNDEADLSYLAHRDPSSVQPGSNEYWGSKLSDVQDSGEKQRLAELQGFLNPQAAAEYSRGMQQQELELPYKTAEMEARSAEERARIAAAAGIQERELANTGAMDIANLQAAQTQRYYDDMAGGNGKVRAFNPRTGAMTMAPERPVAASLLNTQSALRAKAETAGSPWFGGSSPAMAAYEQQTNSILHSDPDIASFPGVIDLAWEIYKNPGLKDLSTEQLLQEVDENGEGIFSADTTPEEIAAFRRARSYIMGHPL